MERYFRWFSERSQSEKLLLASFPFLIVFALYFMLVSPLLEERKKLEGELARLRDVLTLVAKKKSIEKELEELKKTEKLLPFTTDELYEMARRHGVEVLELSEGTPKEVGVSIRGKELNFLARGGITRRTRLPAQQKGKKEEGRFRATLEHYYLKVVGDAKNVRSFLEEIAQNKMVLIGGLYTGCASEDKALRRMWGRSVNVPVMVCEFGKGRDLETYKAVLCSGGSTYPERYYLSFIILNVGD